MWSSIEDVLSSIPDCYLIPFWGRIRPLGSNKASDRVVHHRKKAESSSPSPLAPSPIEKQLLSHPAPMKEAVESLLMRHGHQRVKVGQRRRIWKLTHPVSFKCTQIALGAGFPGRLWLFCISNTSHVLDRRMSCTHLLVKYRMEINLDQLWSINAGDLC